MFYLTTHILYMVIYGVEHSNSETGNLLLLALYELHIPNSNKVLFLYAPSHRQDSTYHGLCYTSCGALAGVVNSSMGPP